MTREQLKVLLDQAHPEVRDWVLDDSFQMLVHYKMALVLAVICATCLLLVVGTGSIAAFLLALVSSVACVITARNFWEVAERIPILVGLLEIGFLKDTDP